jgi:Fe-S cluster assembly protein SufB
MAENIEKINDSESSPYDFKYEEKGFYRNEKGLTAEIVRKLSEDKNDPEWMREFRLKALETYNELKEPEWGPDISGLNIDEIAMLAKEADEA